MYVMTNRKLAASIVAFGLLLVTNGAVSFGQTSSYHIGNSLTWDSQPLGVAAMASEIGFNHEIGYHIRCSWPLNGILGDPNNTCLDPVEEYGKFSEALPNHEWNAVTLQPHPSASFNSTLLSDVASILTFIDVALSEGANDDTTFYIYSGWPKFPDLAVNTYQSSWTATIADLDTTPTTHARQYYEHLIDRVDGATSSNVQFIPVGEVLYELDMKIQDGQIPGLSDIRDLYRDDKHLSLDLGRYVAGVTTLATLFDTDPTGMTKPEDFYGDGAAFTPDFYSVVHSTVWDVVSANQYNGSLFTPGDFQHDGYVDSADLALWEGSYGLGDGADADGDGDTDGKDFLVWQQQFAHPSLLAAAAHVPEPAALSLMAFGVVWLASCRWRRGVFAGETAARKLSVLASSQLAIRLRRVSSHAWAQLNVPGNHAASSHEVLELIRNAPDRNGTPSPESRCAKQSVWRRGRWWSVSCP